MVETWSVSGHFVSSLCFPVQEFAPSDEELAAYRKGEEWDPEKAKELLRMKVSLRLRQTIDTLSGKSGDLRHWRFAMVSQKTEISVFGAQSEMKNVHLFRSFAQIWHFCKTSPCLK